MFIAHEITVDTGFDAATTRLVNLINGGVLRGASGIAYDAGVAAMLRVGPFGGMRGLSKLVCVRFLSPVRRGDTIRVALRWEATGATGELFPVLDADLALTRDGDSQSRLALAGSYRPPFGRAGAALDKAIMHRLAAATIESLLANVAAAMAAAPAPAPQLSIAGTAGFRLATTAGNG